MKLKANSKTLSQALQFVIGAVGKSTLPILSHVHIRASNGCMTMRCTDLSLTISSNTKEVTIEEEGLITVDAKRLLSILRSFPENEVSMTLDGNKLIVKCARSRFSLMTMNAEDYPVLDEKAYDYSFIVNGQQLMTALKSVIHAVGINDARHYLNGVFFDLSEQGKLNIVCTDGHRLAMESIADIVHDLVDDQNQDDTHESKIDSFIVHATYIHLLIKTLKDMASDEDVCVRYNKNSMMIDQGVVCFSSNFIDGKFPDYRRVLPNTSLEGVVSAVILRESLLDAVQRSQIILDKNVTAQATTFLFFGNEVSIECGNSNNEANESVELPFAVDRDCDTHLNGDYVIQALQSFDTESVMFTIGSLQSPVLIQPIEGDGKRVIMTMRLHG